MYPRELIKELQYALPDEIRNIIASDETLSALGEIGDTYQLSIDQAGNLGYAVTMALLGLTLPEKFTPTLIEKLGVTNEIGTKISGAVAEKIFSKIPEKVLHAQGEYAQAKLGGAKMEIPSEKPPINLPTSSALVPEIAPEMLPELVPGQTAHEVEKTTPVISAPVEAKDSGIVVISTEKEKLAYQAGKDPYREPTE